MQKNYCGTYRTIAVASAFLATITSSSLLAANILPPTQADTKASAHVSDAYFMPQGSYRLGINHQYLGSVYTDFDGGKDTAIKEAQTSTVWMEMALSDRLHLGFSLSADDEITSPATRQTVFQNSGLSSLPEKRQQLSGFGISQKLGLLRSENVSLALRTSIHSGTTRGNTYSLLHNDRPTGILALISSLGREDSHHLDMNAGMYYQFPQQVEQYYMRNTAFYSAAAHFKLASDFFLFGSAEGRRLMRATANGPLESGSLDYRPFYSTGYYAGLRTTHKDIEVAAFSGRGREHSDFGQGRKVIGISLTYQPGRVTQNMKINAPDPVKPNQSMPEDAMDNSDLDAARKASKAREGSRGPLGEDRPIDFISDMDYANSKSKNTGEMDDFELVDRQNKASVKKYKPGESPDEKAERELETIRKARKVREEREMREAEAEAARERKKAFKESQRADENARKWEKDVRHEVDDYPYITNEEANWKGLE